jgi:hypothetical protein
MALVARVPKPDSEPVSASVCFEHDSEDGLYYLTIEVEGRQSSFNIGMDHQAFEELLDAGCIVFLDLHNHVHTKVPCRPSVDRVNLN